MKFKSNLFLTITILFALTLTSCGPSHNNSIIATSVALTVQAQNTQAASVTDTPLPLATNPPLTNTPSTNAPAAIRTLTPLAAQPTASSGTKFCTASATFVGETVPDGTIEQPGGQFLKTWHIQNSGTCAWDSTWKFVYVSGDLMGAAVTYPLPSAAPNQTIDFSIVLTAPTDYGSY